jgi:hypothetical protein
MTNYIELRGIWMCSFLYSWDDVFDLLTPGEVEWTDGIGSHGMITDRICGIS